MNDIKSNIAKNLIKLRTQNKMTQSELAKKLNYTDKSISKWEHGDATPPIDVLKAIADLYGVTLDSLVADNSDEFYDKKYNVKSNLANKLLITLLSVSIVWIIATILFVYSSIFKIDKPWLLFVFSVPISMIILLVFNRIWGRRLYTFIIISVLLWSILTSFYLSLLEYNTWKLFITGIPLQIAVILWSQLKTSKKSQNHQ